MFTTTLTIILVIAAVFVIAGIRESHRERSLRAWASSHHGARLIWPFIQAGHPEIPVNSMIELFLSRPPIGLASAMHVTGVDDELLFVEFRTTPLGRDSSHWFTLVAHRGQDAAKRRQIKLPPTELDPRVLNHGPWTCLCLKGLMSVDRLDEVLHQTAKSAA